MNHAASTFIVYFRLAGHRNPHRTFPKRAKRFTKNNLTFRLRSAMNRSLNIIPRPPFWDGSDAIFNRTAAEERWRATLRVRAGDGDLCSPCRGWAISTFCRMSQRFTYFHRVTDCMMVYFARVALAHTLLTQQDKETVVCLVGESGQTYGPSIVPHLLDGILVNTSRSLADATYVVPRRDRRNSTLLIFHGQPRGCAAPIALAPPDVDHWRASKSNARAPKMGELARAMVGRLLPPLPVDLTEATGRYVVLIARQGSSRQWEGPTLQALEDGLGHVARACSTTAAPGGQLRIYEGTESMAATLRLFRRAAVVVGFHGAAFSNVIFSVASVVEVTLYTDSNRTRHWRCNGPESCGGLNMQAWLDVRTKYRVHAVPIEPTLQANSNLSLAGGAAKGLKPCTADADSKQINRKCYSAPWDLNTGSLLPVPGGQLDHLLKNLRVIRLVPSDVKAVEVHLRQIYPRPTDSLDPKSEWETSCKSGDEMPTSADTRSRSTAPR